ncbi:MAG: fumarate hydratase [Deltaproteobacteria bacterium]|nr:fumarate hydratase [Deltaproteobacteria bacterium]
MSILNGYTSRKRDYRLISEYGVTEIEIDGKQFLKIEDGVIQKLSQEAFRDISFYLKKSQFEGWIKILMDPESSENDLLVVNALLKNALISSNGVLPLCQDTGTATVFAFRGSNVLTSGNDIKEIEEAAENIWETENLRYSQMIPSDMFSERNSGNNLPAQIDISLVGGNEFEFIFYAKGGGSSNKTSLFQMSKALLNDKALTSFLTENIKKIGVAACPPYHLSVVIGGTSPEENLKVLKLSSSDIFDGMTESGLYGYRDKLWEKRVIQIARETALGAQFGGRHLVMDARVIRLPRHAGSCPVSIGVSCSAHRVLSGKISPDGVYLENVVKNPSEFITKYLLESGKQIPSVNFDEGIENAISCLDNLAPGKMVLLSGTVVVARDIAHARLAEELEQTGQLPDWFRQYPVYYAGPAKKPDTEIEGSFGPTTAQRMDPYVERFMAHGCSRIMLAKGNRSENISELCSRYNSFYLGTIGGAAALIAKENIVSSEVIAYPELGMEAVRKIVIRNLISFVVSDNKGNSLY